MSLEEAQNPQTTPERLQELSLLNQEVLSCAIAKNPNAPTPLLLKLWAKFPKAFDENPVVELLLLESPQFWSSVPVETMKALLTLPSIPSSLLEQLSTHWSFEVRPLVAKHPNTPPDVLHRLASTYPSSTQQNVAQHPNVRAETLLLLLGSQEKSIPNLAAKHPKMPPEILTLFRRVGGVLEGETSQVDLTLRSEELLPLLPCGLSVISLVQAHPNIEESLLVSLFQKYHRLLSTFFAVNPRLPSKHLEEMAHPEQGGLSRYLALPLAQNPSATTRVLEGCLARADSSILSAIAQRPDLSLELQERLASERDDAIPLALVKNPSASIEKLIPLHEKKNWHLRAALAERRDTPAEILEKLARDKREAVRLAVAQNMMTPAAQLARLLHDESDAVRRAARENPKTPAEEIQSLEDVLSNPEISVERLYKLATGGAYAKQLVVDHPNTPMQLVYQLATSEDSLNRVIVARSHKTPPALLVRLSQDASAEVRAAVAANVATPSSALEALSTESRIDLILHAIAENRATPSSILESLIDVRVKGLRERLAKNPAASPALLKRLFAWLEKNPEPHTLRALLENPNLPASMWAQLGPKHPRVLLQHPRVQALPLQGESSFQSISLKALCAILRVAEIDERFLIWAATHPAQEVRAEVAGHSKTPPRVLASLLREHEDLSVLRRLAKNPKTPQATLAAIIRYDDRFLPYDEQILQRSLIQNKAVPSCVLRWMVEHNPQGLRQDAQRLLSRR